MGYLYDRATADEIIVVAAITGVARGRTVGNGRTIDQDGIVETGTACNPGIGVEVAGAIDDQMVASCEVDGTTGLEIETIGSIFDCGSGKIMSNRISQPGLDTGPGANRVDGAITGSAGGSQLSIGGWT